MPRHGLELAQELFRNAGLVEGRILVLTDGIGASEISDFCNAAFQYQLSVLAPQAAAPYRQSA